MSEAIQVYSNMKDALMAFLRAMELIVKLAALVAIGGALATGLSDLLQGKIQGDDVEEAMQTAVRQLRALIAGRQSWREWRPCYAQLGLVFGLAYGFTYEGVLSGIVGAWIGLALGALLDAHERRQVEEDTNGLR